MRAAFRGLLVLVAVASACSGTRPGEGRDSGAQPDGPSGSDAGEPGCTVENCTKLNMCRLILIGSPDLTGCATRAGVPFNLQDAIPYCPVACNAVHGGKTLICLTAPATACSVDACLPPPPAMETPCHMACGANRSDCNARCPSSTYRECLDCTAACGVDEIACRAACQLDAGRP